MKKKDDFAIVLDYLPYGYPLEGKMKPVVQAVGQEHLSLLELAPIRGTSFTLKEKVYIGPEKRDKIYYIVGRLRKDKITETAKMQLQEFITQVAGEQEKKFIEFFNKAQAINTRLHQIELLPGFGKKHTEDILNAREQKPFGSYEDLKTRAGNIPDPKKAIEKRIMEEILESQRHYLFVN